ncbi:MAG UNVERIFIED_CONTAM: hypothetical protein LVT10_23210 [Anaerolineae bacterium]
MARFGWKNVAKHSASDTNGNRVVRYFRSWLTVLRGYQPAEDWLATQDPIPRPLATRGRAHPLARPRAWVMLCAESPKACIIVEDVRSLSRGVALMST